MRHYKNGKFAALFLAAGILCFPGICANAAEEDTLPEFYRKPALSGFVQTFVYEGDKWDETISKNRIFADDLEDGDLTTKITETGTVNTNVPGTYTLTYSIIDKDGNTSEMDMVVNVLEKGSGEEKTVRRKLYTLPDASHLTEIGFNRGYYHDRQSLGFWLPGSAEFQIRLVNADEFQKNLSIGFYNADQEQESSSQIPSDGSWVTLTNSRRYSSVPFILTPKNTTVQPVLEFKWTDQMREIPYYRYGDDEETFFGRWEDSDAPFAILEGSPATFLVPLKDRDNIVNSSYTSTPEYRFRSIADMMKWYMAFVKQYDAYAGLDFYADEPYNQNVRSKFFIKANAHGVGLAYYGSDHSAYNGDTLGEYLTRSWVSLHEFGHGYEGAIATQENAFVETTNNIMGHYFEKTYRPPTQFGWLLGDSNEPTAEERLATLEQKSLRRKAETNSFNGIVEGGWHYQVSLHMFTNALDRLGPQNTVSSMHAGYRKYYYETGKKRGSSDAVVESFSGEYNMVPYFETYHIKPSMRVENGIYDKDNPILYYLYDLIPDDALAAQVKQKLDLPGVYCLVEPDDLAYTGYTSQVKFQIDIDDLSQIQNKDIVIKNGKKIVETIPVTSGTVEAEIPVGAYEVEIPIPDTVGYSYGNVCLIAAKGSVTQQISYERETGNPLADDRRLTLHGMSDGLFAYAEFDTSEQKMTWNTAAIQPHLYYEDQEYASVRILNPNGETLHEETFIGTETPDDAKTEFDFPVGSKLIVTHDEGAGRMRMMSDYCNDTIPGFSFVKGENVFVMTKYGLMPEGLGEKAQESLYLSCLNQYSEMAADHMDGAQFGDPGKYHQEKLLILNASQSLSEEGRTEYEKKWGIFTGKDTIPIYSKIESGELTGKADSEAGSGTDGLGSAAVDGDETTYWHSNYSGRNEVNFEEDKNTNYTITIQENTDVGRLVYVPRPGGGNGTILSCELYVSETADGDDFVKISHAPVAWENNRSEKTLEFEAKNAKRIRIHVTDAYSDSAKDFISASEFYLYKKTEMSTNGTNVYLSSLSNGRIEAGKARPLKDKNGMGGDICLTVNGQPKTFEKGVGMLAQTTVTYYLDGKGFDTFAAYVGAENETAQGKKADLEIYGDDRLLYEAREMKSGDSAKMLYFNISGIKRLKIAVKGDEGMAVSLADARFYLTEDKDSLTLIVGETARTLSNNAINISGIGSLRFASDNEEVATVDTAGNITATGVGETAIQIIRQGEERPRTCQVIVKNREDIYPEDVVERPDPEQPPDTNEPNQPDQPGQPNQPGQPDAPGASALLQKTAGLSVGKNQTNSLTVSWTAAEGAKGYEVYRAKKGSGAFAMAAKVSGTSYTDKKLSAGTSYTYKVRAYAEKEENKGEFSDEVWSTTKPGKTVIAKVKKSGTKALISWKKNKTAEKYEIWMKEKGKFKKIKDAAGKKTSIKSGKLKKGKKYTFKIRAYRMDSAKKKIYGAFSKTKTLKM